MAPQKQSPKFEASASIVADPSLLEEELRSSFVEMVNRALGGERTSSFSENEPGGDFALGGNAPEETEPVAVPPQIGGRFTIKGPIGKGGFRTVYLAHDESLDRDVAIKVPHEKLRSDPQLSSQCLKEARLAAKLRHPSIVTIFDISETEGRIDYIVQEYVQGATLHALIQQQRLSIKQAIHIIVKVAEAIQFAHARGVYHRDLKPANLIVDDHGGIRVLDFGLAVDEEMQRNSRGQVAGTIAYMSPEQIEGRTHHLDGRTDIWSLGVIFYELLTGRRPFRGNIDEITDQVIRREAAPPRQFLATIPKRVEACCLKCLAKTVSARYGTALDLLEDLKEIVDTEVLPDELPSGPLPTLPQHDTKKLGKDTTKEVPIVTSTINSAWIAVVGALLLMTVFAAPFIWNAIAKSPETRSDDMKNDSATKPQVTEGAPSLSENHLQVVKAPSEKSDAASNQVQQFEVNLLKSRPEELVVSSISGSRINYEDGNLFLQAGSDCVVLSEASVTSPNYDVEIEFQQTPNWNGAVGVVLGVGNSSQSSHHWFGHVVEVGKSIHDGKWKMHYAHIKMNQTAPAIDEVTSMKSDILLATEPVGSQILLVRVREGQIKSADFAGEYIGRIGMKNIADDDLLKTFELQHGIPMTRIVGRIGIYARGASVSISKAVLTKR